ncbi:hypothetical protein MKW92_048302 [Papaver armeniacum]|nr:hypothetical protein MKW92_048302 [Papaver armeniacum]
MIQQQFRNHYLHVEDDDVIGLEEYTKTLLTELEKDDERCCVVSVVGVGGLGKTTLAKKIYKHDTIMNRFHCRGWCSISQQLNLRDVLLEIIKKIMNPNSNELKDLDDKELIEKLYKYLQDKRYFIVVDDLWSFKDWNTLSLAFPNGMRGSKVLLTTRNKRVASQADPWSFKLEPRLLSIEDNSWELLCKKAFPKDVRDTKCYPAGLEKLGREMVHKCGGLPLAICVLGGLLATKKSKKEWEHINKDIPSNINEGKNGGVMGILALSYNDLPIHLKPCFLYFGLFPQDYAIPRKKLIQLWIAEGFIPNTSANTSLTMEDIGKNQYVAELIERCMIQADKVHIYTKTVKVCRIHDLMRDLCLSKAKETNFLDIYNHRIDDITPDSSNTDACKRLRRYALHINDRRQRYDEFYFNNAACSLRTLLIEIPYGSYLMPVKYENIRLLRVLDLVSRSLIRALSLRIDSHEKFNNSIIDSLSCCHNLHRLELDGRLDVLNPNNNYPLNLSKLKLNSSRLKEDPMETLQHLPNLRFLGMEDAYTGEEMVCSTKGFPQLQVLRISECHKLKKWTVDQGGMPHLKELKLNCLLRLSMLPEGLRFITTLKKLNIVGSSLEHRVVREVGEDWYKVQHIPSITFIPEG